MAGPITFAEVQLEQIASTLVEIRDLLRQGLAEPEALVEPDPKPAAKKTPASAARKKS